MNRVPINKVDIDNLSLQGVEQLTKHCEWLIENQQADLAEYELYIRCQGELAKRQHEATAVSERTLTPA